MSAVDFAPADSQDGGARSGGSNESREGGQDFTDLSGVLDAVQDAAVGVAGLIPSAGRKHARDIRRVNRQGQCRNRDTSTPFGGTGENGCYRLGWA
jgi:hypothetical protein